ncbi:hypothetical protein EDB84DRAFT_1542258 [Lactarius hengduanensis]|nr:hypothetical protein EDB84DRAFT_1542258 [Lactarius hengduanensis]
MLSFWSDQPANLTCIRFKSPGSSLIFFEGPQTVNAGDSTYKSSHVGSARIFRYLHCGDFRASPQHTLHPAVKDKKNRYYILGYNPF